MSCQGREKRSAKWPVPAPMKTTALGNTALKTDSKCLLTKVNCAFSPAFALSCLRSLRFQGGGELDISFRRATCKLASFGSVLLRRGVSHKWALCSPAVYRQAKTLSMNLLKSLAAVSSITMLSRVLGFVRD